MDIITQAVVGAAAGGATRIGQPDGLRRAMLLGAAAAVLADADVLLGDADDPIVAQSLHRHFTHSLAFVPFGALLVAGLATLAARWSEQKREAEREAERDETDADRSDVRAPLAFRDCWIAAAGGLLTAGLLDACTGYGTHLLWPFSEARTAWNVISIVDPLFTLPVLACALLAWRHGSGRLCALALLLGIGWLGVGVVQRERAEATLAELAQARGAPTAPMLARPSFANLLVWRGLLRVRDAAGERWQIFAIRPGLGQPTVRSGPALPALDAAGVRRHAASVGMDATAADRFFMLAAGVVTPTPSGLGDLRFAMLPDSGEPLWRLETTPQGLRWIVDRSFDDADRAHFLALLAGDGLAPPDRAP